MWVNEVVFYGIILAVVVLVFTSVIVHDYRFIVEHPWAFCVELAFVGALPALLMVGVFYRTRNVSVKSSFLWFFTLTLKFALFHILLQLSGVYSFLLT